MEAINYNFQKGSELYLDAVVVGAGFAGMYMLHRLREAGFTAHAIEKGSDVGGTWYWARYPGLRCDSLSTCYNYTFSEDIYKEWTWSSKYPEQPEILAYLNFVADKLDLRRDIRFNTEVKGAFFDEESKNWRINLNDGTSFLAKYFITGMGCISANAKNIPNIKGLGQFKGEWYHTGGWPQKKVDFKGKRVGVIGTGSSGIQIIPEIAKEAEHLFVFQRTPQYVIPARNHSLDPEFIKRTKENYHQIKHTMRYVSDSGSLRKKPDRSALEDTPEERQQRYEELWKIGGGEFLVEAYNDLLNNEEANKTAADFVWEKIREIIKDPDLAEELTPNYYIGTKRIVLSTGYFEAYNRENVSLVNVKKAPIKEITPNAILTEDGEYGLDMLVFATGYDGMTGPLLKLDIRGKGGVSLKDKWENGAHVETYLGLSIPEFPNMFTITGPQSPSVLGNVPSMIEQHVEWIIDCIKYLNEHKIESIEASDAAAKEWTKHCNDVANNTLYTKVDSWYTGANIEGKPRAFLIYVGGLQQYRRKCDEIAANEYEGFLLEAVQKTKL